STHDWRGVEHFDAGWTPLPEYNRAEGRPAFPPFGGTPGPGPRWSRLLLNSRGPSWLLEGAQGLFARAVADGWSDDRGFVYTTDFDGQPVVTDRLPWVMAGG